MKNNTGQIRGMKEASRSKFIRLKGKSIFWVGRKWVWTGVTRTTILQRVDFSAFLGIPEDPDEDTVEKIIELLEYLGYQVEADEIERANRVGEKSADKTTPRAIVVELVSFKLKQSILKEAAQKLRHTPYR